MITCGEISRRLKLRARAAGALQTDRIEVRPDVREGAVDLYVKSTFTHGPEGDERSGGGLSLVFRNVAEDDLDAVIDRFAKAHAAAELAVRPQETET